jgi:hypothetical protein
MFFLLSKILIQLCNIELDVNLIEVTNRSLSIIWRAPMFPNYESTYYQVFGSNDTNPWTTRDTTQVKKKFTNQFIRYRLSLVTTRNVNR